VAAALVPQLLCTGLAAGLTLGCCLLQLAPPVFACWPWVMVLHGMCLAAHMMLPLPFARSSLWAAANCGLMLAALRAGAPGGLRPGVAAQLLASLAAGLALKHAHERGSRRAFLATLRAEQQQAQQEQAAAAPASQAGAAAPADGECATAGSTARATKGAAPAPQDAAQQPADLPAAARDAPAAPAAAAAPGSTAPSRATHQQQQLRRSPNAPHTAAAATAQRPAAPGAAPAAPPAGAVPQHPAAVARPAAVAPSSLYASPLPAPSHALVSVKLEPPPGATPGACVLVSKRQSALLCCEAGRWRASCPTCRTHHVLPCLPAAAAARAQRPWLLPWPG
jgi:hypothetical protein